MKDTLKYLSGFSDAIIAYDDASTDNTLSILKSSEKVVGVLENKDWSEERIEFQGRARGQLLEEAKGLNPDWVLCADTDERLVGDVRNCLESLPDSVHAVRPRLFDAYMTPDDREPYREQELLNFRKWFGVEYREINMFWRPQVGWRLGGYREPRDIPHSKSPVEQPMVSKQFFCQHYGKSLSEKHWEDTCAYYSTYFDGDWALKWENRKGKAIHTLSDFGTPLVTWEQCVKGEGVIELP